MAMADVTSVPKMSGSAPNLLKFGAQLRPVTKWNPSCEKTRSLFVASTTTMRTSSAISPRANPELVPRNSRSPRRGRRLGAPVSRSTVVALRGFELLRVRRQRRSRVLEIGDVRDGGRGHRGRQRREVQVLHLGLARR